MKIKFISENELLLNETIEIPSMITVVRVAFYENNKNYPQVLSDKCLYKLWKQKKKTFLYFICLFINYYYIINNC